MLQRNRDTDARRVFPGNRMGSARFLQSRVEGGLVSTASLSRRREALCSRYRNIDEYTFSEKKCDFKLRQRDHSKVRTFKSRHG